MRHKEEYDTQNRILPNVPCTTEKEGQGTNSVVEFNTVVARLLADKWCSKSTPANDPRYNGRNNAQ